MKIMPTLLTFFIVYLFVVFIVIPVTSTQEIQSNSYSVPLQLKPEIKTKIKPKIKPKTEPETETISDIKSFYLGKLRISNRYEKMIKRSANLNLDNWDWKLWYAQVIQESLLDPNAKSFSGAMGLAQIMPETYKEESRRLGLLGSNPYDPENSLKVGSYYMKKMMHVWRSQKGRSYSDSQKLAQSSYNAGAGNIIKSQKICKGSRTYNEIIKCLPKVTGKRSKETLTYIKRIYKYYYLML